MAMTVQNLVTSQQARSNLRWLAGQSGGDRPCTAPASTPSTRSAT